MPLIARRKVVLSRYYYFIAALIIAMGLAEGYSYSRLESSPRTTTAQELGSLFEARRGKHWVRISGLQIDCSRAIEQTKDGKVSRTFYTAIGGNEPMIIVEDSSPCDADPSHPHEGMLEPNAGDYVLRQIAGAGVSVPAGDVPRLAVGDTPASSLHAAMIFVGCGIVAVGGVWWSRRS
jgi:hypothetical protein